MDLLKVSLPEVPRSLSEVTEVVGGLRGSKYGGGSNTLRRQNDFFFSKENNSLGRNQKESIKEKSLSLFMQH